MSNLTTFNPEDRHLIVISGELNDCLTIARNLVINLNTLELDDPKKANTFLGQEFDAVIFHSHDFFDPNAWGAVAGTIRLGGYLLLLKPSDYPKNSLFLKRLDDLLNASKSVVFINSKDATPNALPNITSKPSCKTGELTGNISSYATEDQQHAVAAIVQVIKGHRRRPLVLTSDRGRGKSSALGIAAAMLSTQGYNKIIICAPSKIIAAMAFTHANRLNPKAVDTGNIYFYSPDDLQRQKPTADLVLVDEAAAIPVNILTRLLSHYSRIVFASTQHGYEGSGRGFSINFKKVLDKQTPDWAHYHLNQPIRWNQDDSLEKFTFDALLLNAEPSDLTPDIRNKIELDQSCFSKMSKTELLNDETTLITFFGLLVGAHYQTKPSDLIHLLDDDDTIPYYLSYKDTIIAVALVIKEGQIDNALIPDIFAGKRRIQGHLVAQSLSVNVGIENATQLTGDRISRIAVHPELQNRGVGTYFLQKLVENSTADYVSTSFGATPLLINFWQSSGFESVYLGMKRDASSGTHSVIMLHAKSKDGEQLQLHAQNNFAQNFPHLLSDPLRTLETELAFSLLPLYTHIADHPPTFKASEKNQLNEFAHGFRGYENSLSLIWKLVITQLPKNTLLSAIEKNILIIKVLQKHSWEALSKRMQDDIKGKKEAIRLIRTSIKKLLH